eukprot:SAG11_NODE_10789_length_805_cov_1.381020_2_plen_153_part_00
MQAGWNSVCYTIRAFIQIFSLSRGLRVIAHAVNCTDAKALISGHCVHRSGHIQCASCRNTHQFSMGASQGVECIGRCKHMRTEVNMVRLHPVCKFRSFNDLLNFDVVLRELCCSFNLHGVPLARVEPLRLHGEGRAAACDGLASATLSRHTD